MITRISAHLLSSNKNHCVVSPHCQEKGIGAHFPMNAPREKLLKLQVDGCLIDDQSTKKCDCLYLYQRSTSKRYALLVELKGNNINRALPQLQQSLHHPNIQKLIELAGKPKVIAVAVIPERAKTYNRAQTTEWQNNNKIQLAVKTCKEGSSVNLSELIA